MGTRRTRASSSSGSRRSTWEEGLTVPAELHIHNRTAWPLDVLWVDYEGAEQHYASLQPGGVSLQHTFSTHPWRFVRFGSTGASAAATTASYVGPSAVLHVRPGGWLDVLPLPAGADADAAAGAGAGVGAGATDAEGAEDVGSWMKPEWGSYRQRGIVLGMPIMAYDCVGAEAVSGVASCISAMMATARPDILTRLVEAGCSFAIIGRGQVVTDMPPHHFMRRQAAHGGRDVDTTARGLGATRAVPCSSVGEENVLMSDDTHYPCESILVHEFAHAVMNLGFGPQDTAAVRRLFSQARRSGLYELDCYSMANADEYWAEGSQAHFGATTRSDVNSGINSRQLLQEHDPGLAQLLEQVYGPNAWQYTDTSPGQFKQPQRRQQQQQQSARGSKRQRGDGGQEDSHVAEAAAGQQQQQRRRRQEEEQDEEDEEDEEHQQERPQRQRQRRQPSTGRQGPAGGGGGGSGGRSNSSGGGSTPQQRQSSKRLRRH